MRTGRIKRKIPMVRFQRLEKKEVMDMLYKYKDIFSLWDEIGICPNIEVEIDVVDKSPYFITM